MSPALSKDIEAQNERIHLNRNSSTASSSYSTFSAPSPQLFDCDPLSSLFDFIELDSGDIVSENNVLTENSDALHHFIGTQCRSSPSIRIRCAGETIHAGPEPNVVKDFDFTVEIPTLDVKHGGPIFWTVSDSDPAFRGKPFPEIIHSGRRRPSEDIENVEHMRWVTECTDRGLPPWADEVQTFYPEGCEQLLANTSNICLRHWIEEFCNSSNTRKEFVYQKVPYGFDLRHIENSLISIVQSMKYLGKMRVQFAIQGSSIVIRSNTSNRHLLRKAFASPWMQRCIRICIPCITTLSILCIILSIYVSRSQLPNWFFFTLLVLLGSLCVAFLAICVSTCVDALRLKPKAIWQTCGAAYPTHRWVLLSPTSPEAKAHLSYPDGSYCDTEHRLVRTGDSVSKLVGTTEEEWFKSWEGAIRKAIENRFGTGQVLQVGRR